MAPTLPPQQNDLQANPLASDLDYILTHTESLWEDLRGQCLFITGGTSFFGCWLLESLAWANAKLNLNASALVLTRDYEAFARKAPHLAANPAIQFHIGDVRNFKFPQGKFSHIIHAASISAEAKFNNTDALLMFDTIVAGTRHTLDFAAQCQAKKFLLTSSGAVYGKQPFNLAQMAEDFCGCLDPADPNSTIGESKRTAELLCTLYSRKYALDTKIARCFAFVGPYLQLDIQYAIGNFIRAGLNRAPILIKGDGTPYRSYLYAADLVIWLWTILFRGQACRPYNVGSEEAIEIHALAKIIAQMFHPELEVRVLQKRTSARPAERYIPSTHRALQELHLQQRIDLQASLQRTLTWHTHQSKG